jgi:hypothetical protein
LSSKESWKPELEDDNRSSYPDMTATTIDKLGRCSEAQAGNTSFARLKLRMVMTQLPRQTLPKLIHVL